MELKVEIGFDELLSAIKKLPEDKIAILKKEISKSQKNKELPSYNKDLEALLLKGPVMTDEQYRTFKETRKSFKQWRKK